MATIINRVTERRKLFYVLLHSDDLKILAKGSTLSMFLFTWIVEIKWIYTRQQIEK